MSERDNTAAAVPFVPAARAPTAAYSSSEIAVAAPPAVSGGSRTGFVVRLLPVLMAMATVGMMAAVFRSGSSAGRQPAFLIFPTMMVISAVIAAVTNRDGRAGEVNAARAEYLNYLAGLRDSVTKTAAAQAAALRCCHPDPGSLWTLVGSSRMWERTPTDPDFGHVRVGIGNQLSAARLLPPEIGASERTDPVTSSALRAFIGQHATINDAPITIDMRALATVTIAGRPQPARALLRAMICQLAVLHPPNVLLIVAAIGNRNRCHWEWLKWLPHNQHPSARDALGSLRMVYPTLLAAEAALAGLLDRSAQLTTSDVPQAVIIVDGEAVESTDRVVRVPAAGVTVCEITGSEARLTADMRLQVTPTELILSHAGTQDVAARPDQIDAVAALVCARLLAGYRIDAPASLSCRDGRARWQNLLGVADLDAFDPIALWRSRDHRDRLRVPVGTTAGNVPVDLDIKEAAEDGVGPHGLCIGATGSGKSEFLRTVVLGMLARHSPELLNLILIDFKGGATFRGLEQAPHVAALITNLAGEAVLVERMRDALSGEINRRQEMLRVAGNFVSLSAYQQARRAGAQLAALPTLLIIVDEFSELLAQQPDFADMFAAIGRVGRSLGMHLLLASQRLDEGRLRGLESHLSYRVCLKTLTANESRMVLGTTDAYQLPNTPGAAILRSATGELARFQTAFVSAGCTPAVSPQLPQHSESTPRVRLFSAAQTGELTSARMSGADIVTARTVLQTVVRRLTGYGPRAHEVWLPPLGSSPALNTLLSGAPASTTGLSVPIGIVDRPFEQRRTPLTVDLAGAAGNVAVVGAPQSGKSTALRTLVTAMAVTHDPSRVQFYCLDFGGGALASLRSLPHTGSVAGGAEPDLVVRTVAQLESVLRRRERFFDEHGIESMAHYRRSRAEDDTGSDGFNDLFLVVDGWTTMRRQFETLETSITALALAGLSFGVHVVLSASRWADLRPALKDAIGTRIELRLGDAADSEVNRKQAQQVPKNRPGRGLSSEGLHMVIAVPRLDGVESADGLAEAATQLGQKLRHRYGDITASPVRLLPVHVDHHALVQRTGMDFGGEVLLGVEGDELGPLAIDFKHHAHLLVLGDNECGKTATLRTLCHEIARTHTAEQARLLIADFRRGLFGAVEPEHLGGYAMSPAALTALLPGLVDLLRNRMAPTQVTMEQLRSRSWWSGPEIYLVVDDYDLVATATGNPLAPLIEYLPYANDMGLHLIVARRSAGAARALFEPLLACLRDLGAVGLMMSGSPEDGPLIGSVRPTPLPPGRGILITRNGEERLVQVAWTPTP